MGGGIGSGMGTGTGAGAGAGALVVVVGDGSGRMTIGPGNCSPEGPLSAVLIRKPPKARTTIAAAAIRPARTAWPDRITTSACPTPMTDA